MIPKVDSNDRQYVESPKIGGPNTLQKSKDLMKVHMNQKVMVIDDVDRQVWELVTDVPRVDIKIAYLQAFLNFIFPGIGTWVTACAGHDNVSKTQLGIGLMQLLTSPFILLGWIWGLYWSYLVVLKAQQPE